MPAFEIVTESIWIHKYYVVAETIEKAIEEIRAQEAPITDARVVDMYYKHSREVIIDSYEVTSYEDWINITTEDGFV